MNKELRWKFAVVLVVLVISLWFAIPWDRPFPKSAEMRFGLDLQGGTEILYKLRDLTPEEVREYEGVDLASEIIMVIERRINTHGLKEFKLRKHGGDRILIQLPGSDEEETAELRKLIESSGKLEFRIVAADDVKQRFKEPQAPPDHKWLPYARSASMTGSDLIQMRDSWNFTGDKLKSSRPSTSDNGFPAVGFTIKREHVETFRDLTTVNTGRQLAIIMDSKIISAPVINEAIGEQGVISGKFSIAEQERLVTVLKSGTFPVDLEFESINRVGPGIGTDSIAKGMRAIIIASVAVLAFIAIYYLGVGMVANFALLFNLAIILAFMTLFGATMTLPGIAGILLTVGMAVDANILIYERIREEKAKGKTLAQSVKNGYDRAFVTIVDANITTLFTAGILYLVGTGPIKGFAVTLSIGIAASMFTALFATRAIFEFLVGAKAVTEFRMLSIVSKPNIAFIKKAPAAILISIALIAGGLLLFAYRGEKNLGIDFRNGTIIDFNISSDLSVDAVRNRVSNYIPPGETQKLYAKAEVQEMWDFEGDTDTGQGSKHFEVRIAKMIPADKFEADIRQMFKAELIPSPFSDEVVNANTYRISFDFDLQNEANVQKLIQIANPAVNLYAGTLKAKETRSYSKSFRFESDLVTEDPDPVKAETAVRNRILGLQSVLKEDYDFDGEIPKNLMVEQYGNMSVTVNLGRPVPAKEIRKMLKLFEEVKIAPDTGESTIFTLSASEFKGFSKDKPFYQRMKDWKEVLRKEFKKQDIQLSEPISRLQSIGPVVAKELTEQGSWALILSLIVIILYIAFRFHLSASSPYTGQAGLGSFIKDLLYKARFGFAAITAVVHDVLITMGFIAICAQFGIVDVKIDLQILAAFLTIIGYSLNDTIVVFDRIRENVNVAAGKGRSFGEVVNTSINQTLSRTLLTSVTTFVVVLALFIFGGRIIRGFSFALLVGVVVGTYSSIFIAAPVLVFWERMARTVKPGEGKAPAKAKG